MVQQTRSHAPVSLVVRLSVHASFYLLLARGRSHRGLIFLTSFDVASVLMTPSRNQPGTHVILPLSFSGSSHSSFTTRPGQYPTLSLPLFTPIECTSSSRHVDVSDRTPWASFSLGLPRRGFGFHKFHTYCDMS